MILNLYVNVLETNLIWTIWGCAYQILENQFSYMIILITGIWMLSIFLISLIFIIWLYFNADEINKKNQSKILFIGLSISLLIFSFDMFIIPFLFEIILPEFSIFGSIVSCIAIAYSMSKHKMFILDLSSTSRDIVYSLRDLLFILNKSGEIIATNQSVDKVLKYKEIELIKKRFETLISSGEGYSIYLYQCQKIKQSYENIMIEDFEVNLKSKDGIIIPILLSISIITNNENELKGMVIIGKDLTLKRKLEVELEEAIKISSFKSRFLTSMSHELRTPLNSIIGFTDLLLSSSCGDLNECVNDYLLDISFSSKHLLSLINQILDISKIEAGELKLDYQDIELDALINQIVSTVKPLCLEKKLDFNVIGLEPNKVIRTDRTCFIEVLFNLLNNAIKYTDIGGITLNINERLDLWEFSINDTGIGISEENFNLIFDEYKRVDSPYIRSNEGAGLGLPLTKKLIELFQGEINFISDMGKGTTFFVRLPKIVS